MSAAPARRWARRSRRRWWRLAVAVPVLLVVMCAVALTMLCETPRRAGDAPP